MRNEIAGLIYFLYFYVVIKSLRVVGYDSNFLCLFPILESIEVFMASTTILFPINLDIVNTLRNATLRKTVHMP